MMQVVEQTHKEKMKIYMKLSKKQLAEMLINCNEIISGMPIHVSFKIESPTVEWMDFKKRTNRKS